MKRHYFSSPENMKTPFYSTIHFPQLNKNLLIIVNKYNFFFLVLKIRFFYVYYVFFYLKKLWIEVTALPSAWPVR